MEIVKMKVSDLIEYENNPRKNEAASVAVMESIRQCGYVAPIIVDENNVILAGHTRKKALEKLGIDTAEVIVRKGLSEEQKKKYRLLDNKTNEFASWDFEKLEEELADLDFEGFDFGFTEIEAEFEDINDEGVEDKSGNGHHWSIDNKQYPLSDDEYELLRNCFDAYVESAGVAFGFIGSVLGNEM